MLSVGHSKLRKWQVPFCVAQRRCSCSCRLEPQSQPQLRLRWQSHSLRPPPLQPVFPLTPPNPWPRPLQEGRPHVPYRNSLLTQMLKDSLGGNCRTVMIANVAPEAQHIEESISTCRFAQRVAMISNQVCCAALCCAGDVAVLRFGARRPALRAWQRPCQGHLLPTAQHPAGASCQLQQAAPCRGCSTQLAAARFCPHFLPLRTPPAPPLTPPPPPPCRSL